MRGEKMYLQNCVGCHSQPQAISSFASAEKVEKIANGQHPQTSGVHDFKSIFDKKAVRSLVSYLEAFKFQTAKN
jgi:mono/diheme cytochrome c family protein